MAHYVRGQVSLQNDGGLLQDAAVNVLHFRGTAVDIEDVLDATDSFINALYQLFESSLSAVLSGDGQVKWYDLTDPEPRSPIRTTDFSFSPSASAILPNECAWCFTLEGAAVSGVPIGRRRGRLFLGPLSQAVMDPQEPDARIATSWSTPIVTGFAAAIADMEENSCTLQVLSRTLMGSPPWTEGELDAGTFTVVAVSSDNAFDTIRSRGAAPTVRTRVTVA